MLLAAVSIQTNDFQRVTLAYNLGYCLTLNAGVLVSTLSRSLLSQIVSRDTRGTIFSLNGLAGSVSIAILNGVGGAMYKHVSKLAPIWIAIGLWVAQAALTLALGLRGKLKY